MPPSTKTLACSDSVPSSKMMMRRLMPEAKAAAAEVVVPRAASVVADADPSKLSRRLRRTSPLYERSELKIAHTRCATYESDLRQA